MHLKNRIQNWSTFKKRVALISLLVVGGLACFLAQWVPKGPAVSTLNSIKSSNYRRGPALKGFQLGMTVAEFQQNLKKVYPESLKELRYIGPARPIGDPMYDNFLIKNDEYRQINFEKANRGIPICEIKSFCDSDIIFAICLRRPVVEKMYDLKGMRFRDFCQEMINNYKIPRLETGLERITNSPVLGFYSKEEGYTIELGGQIIESVEINLRVDKKIDSPQLNRDRGFGR